MTPSVLVLVAGLWWQGAPPPAPPSTEALGQAYFLFMQGRTLESSGDVTGAVTAFRKALELVPAAAEVHAELAGLFARQNRADDAMSEALEALKIDSGNQEAHRILGFVQAALADSTRDAARQNALITEAIGHFEQALAGRRDIGAQFTLGRLYVRAGQHEKGINVLRQFLLAQPGYPDAMMLLAQAYDATHKSAEAIGTLEELIADQPDQVRAKSWLADLYEQAGRWKDAAAAWADLAGRNPRNATFRFRRATALANSGDVAGGRQALQDILKDSPRDASAWYALSQIERRAGNAAAAEDAARHLVDLDPADRRGPIALAEAKSSRGDYRGAIETLEPLVSAARDEDVASGAYARMAEGLATALQDSGDRNRSVTVLEGARKRDPASQSLLFALATAYERTERIDQAERLVRELVDGEPKNADALNYLGYMLADHGRKLDEAVDLITRALVIEPGNPSYLDSLGWAYFKQAKLDRAIAPLEQASAGLPRSSVIQDHVGDLYFQLKRYREAAAAFDRALDGDRQSIDAAAITKKRDRAKALAGR